MNKVVLMGRLTRDIELKYANTSNGELAVARFTLAVPKNVKGKDGKVAVDFINCVAFGKMGEFASKYFKKGQRVLVSGRIQMENYTDKEGNKRTSFDVVIEQQEFADSKATTESNAGNSAESNDILSGFEDMGATDDELLFN